jgi:hypothetical protein
MELIFSNIKTFMCSFNGVLSIKPHYVSTEVAEVYDIIHTLEYDHPIVDRKNLHGDIKNIGNDIKKAKIKYELSHGEIHEGK